ncbi:MAG: hypothetical protein R3F37_05180 [Candidatus Competibacteraceae bacterium]
MLDSVVEKGRVIVTARKTANLPHRRHHSRCHRHSASMPGGGLGGEALPHPEIPVVGLDFMVRTPDQPAHVIIEANERSGSANHEPQPTAQRFIDLLFPLSISGRWTGTADD